MTVGSYIRYKGIFPETEADVLTSREFSKRTGEFAGEVLMFVGVEAAVQVRVGKLTSAADVAPNKLPVKPQHPDVSVVPKNPLSKPVSASTPPGDYVYVQDANGVVNVVPNGPHLHPTVLGGGQPAAAAGEIVINSKGVVTEINNISYTFQHDACVLQGVMAALEKAGLKVASDAIKPFEF